MLKYKGDLENKGTNVILMVEVPADRITPGLLTLVKEKGVHLVTLPPENLLQKALLKA